MESLAVKYRPKEFESVVGQEAIKAILTQQLKTNTTKNAYLFVGGAGTGKTTCARILANALNNYKGNPIEMDAASNNSVDNIRDIIQEAKTRSLNSEYKVFILDEVHVLSNTAWQAMLKLLEEPPAKSIFIMCTTNPEKIPKTILSRVQRYDFQRISHQDIVERLEYILYEEYLPTEIVIDKAALQYIAKLADGGMRDAITLLDKCLAYSESITLANVVNALGTVDYNIMFSLTEMLAYRNQRGIIETIEGIYASGKDLKQFIKQYLNFMLDLCKYISEIDFKYLSMPAIDEYKDKLSGFKTNSVDVYVNCYNWLDMLVKLNADIKYETNPKALIEANLLLGCVE